jgi:hypothetical protein
MRLLLILSVTFVGVGLSACSTMFERDPRTGYASDSEGTNQAGDFYRERREKNEEDAREDLGYQGRPLSEAEAARLNQRLRLQRLESNLESKRDKQQYYSMRSYMKNDNERIYFLSLGDFETKQRWLANRGLQRDNDTAEPSVAKAIETNDLILGMSEKAVKESWGDPDVVEVAGNPVYGHTRWNYNRQVASGEGFQKQDRIVYFEGGRVTGWETPQ